MNQTIAIEGFIFDIERLSEKNRATYPHSNCLNTWAQSCVASFNIDWSFCMYSPYFQQIWSLIYKIYRDVYLKMMKNMLGEWTRVCTHSQLRIGVSLWKNNRFVYTLAIFILLTLYDTYVDDACTIYETQRFACIGFELKVSTRISFSTLFYCILLRMTHYDELLCIHIRNVEKRERKRKKPTAEN